MPSAQHASSMHSAAAAPALSCSELLRIGGDVLEAPSWDTRRSELTFVDIPAGMVHRMSWSGQDVTTTRFAESVSAVIPRASGGDVVACRRGIATSDGSELRLVLPIEAERSWSRSNDAKCDPAGRLWIGTMADDERSNGGTLYQVTPGWRCTAVVRDVTISNGLGWSPDGQRMYYIDSPTRRVDVFDYDTASGTATDRRPFIDTSQFAGLPDGLSVDAEGGIWVAFYGGSAVRRFSSDGMLLRTADVPTPNVTSCAFAGPDLDALVITTARAHDSSAHPGGAVFIAQPGVLGMPTSEFTG